MGNYLMHYAKGETAKNHKWVERKKTANGYSYKYPKDMKELGARASRYEREANAARAGAYVNKKKGNSEAAKTNRSEAHLNTAISEDMKRRANSALAAQDRKDRDNAYARKYTEESKKLKNRGKRFIQKHFGKRTIRTKDGIIFKNGLRQTKVTFGEVKVSHPH